MRVIRTFQWIKKEIWRATLPVGLETHRTADLEVGATDFGEGASCGEQREEGGRGFAAWVDF